MNSFYSDGFEDYKAKYLQKVKASVSRSGIIAVLMMIDAEYQVLYHKALIPELAVESELVKIETPYWFWGSVGVVGFAGLLEWLSEIVSACAVSSSIRDKAAVQLLATQLRAKSQILLVQGLKATSA